MTSSESLRPGYSTRTEIPLRINIEYKRALSATKTCSRKQFAPAFASAPALRGRVRAFTLVELLIATGITVLIVVMLGWMLGSLMSSAAHTTERVDAFRDARAALQMMERDLRNLLRTQWSPDPFTNPIPVPCAASATSWSS